MCSIAKKKLIHIYNSTISVNHFLYYVHEKRNKTIKPTAYILCTFFVLRSTIDNSSDFNGKSINQSKILLTAIGICLTFA